MHEHDYPAADPMPRQQSAARQEAIDMLNEIEALEHVRDLLGKMPAKTRYGQVAAQVYTEINEVLDGDSKATQKRR